MIPSPDTVLSRIEMRLLRETRSVLEYLQWKGAVRQIRGWRDHDDPLHLPDNEPAVCERIDSK